MLSPGCIEQETGMAAFDQGDVAAQQGIGLNVPPHVMRLDAENIGVRDRFLQASTARTPFAAMMSRSRLKPHYSPSGSPG